MPLLRLMVELPPKVCPKSMEPPVWLKVPPDTVSVGEVVAVRHFGLVGKKEHLEDSIHRLTLAA